MEKLLAKIKTIGFLPLVVRLSLSNADCCNSGGTVNANQECDGWNTAAAYKICPGSCKDGNFVCQQIAGSSSSSVTAVEIGEGACVGIDGVCYAIGRDSSTLTRIKIPANECNEPGVGGVNGETCNYNEACNYTPPPEEPNLCKNVNCSNRGKCQVLSFTEAECKCENTFIQSDNKLDCICPSDYEFNANANRCFPITEAPSKSPTSSLVATPSLSPSQEPTEDKEEDELPCEDDFSSTFTLDNGNIVDCKWILKNKKRRIVRKAKYCVREEIMNMCPVSCDACSA